LVLANILPIQLCSFSDFLSLGQFQLGVTVAPSNIRLKSHLQYPAPSVRFQIGII